MKSMQEQFADILLPRLGKMNEKAGQDVAKLFSARMKENTRQGIGFGSDPYDSSYSKSHRRVRRKKGLQTGRVDLRMDKRRIERTTEQTQGKQTNIRFVEGGDIFNYHHKGTARGGKTRSIWPKSPASVPDVLLQQTKEKIHEVLSGQK